jgi:hypothetical protein
MPGLNMKNKTELPLTASMAYLTLVCLPSPASFPCGFAHKKTELPSSRRHDLKPGSPAILPANVHLTHLACDVPKTALASFQCAAASPVNPSASIK